MAAQSDLPRSGRATRIIPQERAWIASVACVKPGEPDCREELWTTRRLARERKAASKSPQAALMMFASYDEKPSIQAIGGVAADLAPRPGQHAATGCDREYKRLGTITLIPGLDLLTGHIHRAVAERNRSREFEPGRLPLKCVLAYICFV